MNIEVKKFEKTNYEITVSHFKQENPEGVLIVFPGAGYSCMGPCLYYPSNLFLENNYEVLNLEYDFRVNRLKDNSKESYSNYFDFIFSCLSELELPEKKIALCKSIGTRIVASNKLNDLFSEIIWLTPAIKDEFVFEEIMKKANKSLIVIGTADQFYADDKVLMMESSGARCNRVLGADHGLDIDGDTGSSIVQMEKVVTWIGQNSHTL